MRLPGARRLAVALLLVGAIGCGPKADIVLTIQRSDASSTIAVKVCPVSQAGDGGTADCLANQQSLDVFTAMTASAQSQSVWIHVHDSSSAVLIELTGNTSGTASTVDFTADVRQVPELDVAMDFDPSTALLFDQPTCSPRQGLCGDLMVVPSDPSGGN